MLCNLKLALKPSHYCAIFVGLLCKVEGFFLSPCEEMMNLASVVKRQLNQGLQHLANTAEMKT